jgi:hypothetical protein
MILTKIKPVDLRTRCGALPGFAVELLRNPHRHCLFLSLGTMGKNLVMGYMRPCAPVPNSADRFSAHFKLSRHLVAGHNSMKGHDLSDNFRRELPRPALFGPHVGGIVRIGSDKQMRRIAAGRIIAAMTNNEPFGDVSVRELERNSMCSEPAPSNIELPVSSPGLMSRPFPAFARTVARDSAPEVILDRFMNSRVNHPSAPNARERVRRGGMFRLSAQVTSAPFRAEPWGGRLRRGW